MRSSTGHDRDVMNAVARIAEGLSHQKPKDIEESLDILEAQYERVFPPTPRTGWFQRLLGRPGLTSPKAQLDVVYSGLDDFDYLTALTAANSLHAMASKKVSGAEDASRKAHEEFDMHLRVEIGPFNSPFLANTRSELLRTMEFRSQMASLWPGYATESPALTDNVKPDPYDEQRERVHMVAWEGGLRDAKSQFDPFALSIVRYAIRSFRPQSC